MKEKATSIKRSVLNRLAGEVGNLGKVSTVNTKQGGKSN